MTYQATLQVNNAIVFNDFTMQPHFRDYMLRVDGAIVTVEAGIVSASGTAAWGGITGTLSAQTDLNSALNGKASTAVFTDVANGLAPLSGGGTTNFLRADGSWAAPSGGGSGLTHPQVMARLSVGF